MNTYTLALCFKRVLCLGCISATYENLIDVNGISIKLENIVALDSALVMARSSAVAVSPAIEAVVLRIILVRAIKLNG
jgi:hypothetical protein